TAAATASRCAPSGSASGGFGGAGARAAAPPPQATSAAQRAAWATGATGIEGRRIIAATVAAAPRAHHAARGTLRAERPGRRYAAAPGRARVREAPMRASALAAAAALSASAAACIGELPEETSAASWDVLGGKNAPAGKWPDVAAVMIGGQPQCTGVLIAPTVALTAGHCNDPLLGSILVGTTSLSRPTEGEALGVVRRIEHPS